MWPRIALASLLPVVLALACTGPDEYFRDRDPGTGTGGASATGLGGSTGAGTGGTSATGTGGTSGTGTGGSSATGTGGTSATGTGGTSATGTGGTPATGTGGTSATGTGGTGGSVATGAGGAAGTGGPLRMVFNATFEPAMPNGVYTWISPPGDTGAWSVATDGTNHVWREATNTSDEAKSISGDFNWTNQVIELRARVTAGDIGGVRVLIYGRYQDDKNYFFLELGETQVKLRKKINGSSTDIGRYKFPSGMTLTANTWYTLKLELNGTVFRAYVNGMPSDPAIDIGAVFAHGGIGVGVADGAADFDDVKVSAQ